MAVISGALKAVTVGAFALLLESLASVAGEVFEESGITYEEGHPTACGGVGGWNPLKSIVTKFRIVYSYREGRLNFG